MSGLIYIDVAVDLRRVEDRLPGARTRVSSTTEGCPTARGPETAPVVASVIVSVRPDYV